MTSSQSISLIGAPTGLQFNWFVGETELETRGKALNLVHKETTLCWGKNTRTIANCANKEHGRKIRQRDNKYRQLCNKGCTKLLRELTHQSNPWNINEGAFVDLHTRACISIGFATKAVAVKIDPAFEKASFQEITNIF